METRIYPNPDGLTTPCFFCTTGRLEREIISMNALEPKPSLLRQYEGRKFNFVKLRRWNEKSKQGREIGKAPLQMAWTCAEVPYEEAVAHMQKGNNVGVQLSVNGFCVLDYDPRQDPQAGTPENALARLMEEVGLDPSKQCYVITGNLEGKARGQHIYLRIDPAWRGRTKLPKNDNPYPGCEFKHSPGQQVVAAGSIHPSGGRYEFHPESAPLADAQPAPKALLNIFKLSAPDRHLRGEGETSWGAFEPEEIRDALSHLDVLDYNGEHDEWLALMMACHWATGGEGADDWVEWCIGDPEYENDAENIRERWDTLSVDGSGPKVTGALIFKKLMEAGVEPSKFPRRKIEMMFDDIPEEELITDLEPASPETLVLKAMNDKHALVAEGMKPYYLKPEYDEITDAATVGFTEAQTLRALYSNKFITIPVEKKNGQVEFQKVTYFDYWNTHEKRRTYDGTEFNPASEDNSRETPGGLIFNLFRGFPYSRLERGDGDWKRFGELILHSLAGGNPEHEKYILDWVAYSLQNPAGPQGIAMVFRGEKGVGKGLFAHRWIKLFGAAGFTTASADDVFGRFNNRIATTCALFLDEATWAGDMARNSSMKNIITEPVIRSEEKFRSVKQIRNHLKVIMTTNEDWAVPASTDERRFVVFDVVRAYPEGSTFYKSVINEMDHNGGMQAWFYDMMHRDIRGFNPTVDYPKTQALKDQIMLTMGEIAPWWIDLLDEGEIPHSFIPGSLGGIPQWANSEIAVPYKEFRELFKNSGASLEGDWHFRFDQKFGSEFKRMIPVSKMDIRNLTPPQTDDFLNVHTARDGRTKCLILPPLPACREYAGKMFGYEKDQIVFAKPEDPGDLDDLL